MQLESRACEHLKVEHYRQREEQVQTPWGESVFGTSEEQQTDRCGWEAVNGRSVVVDNVAEITEVQITQGLQTG